MERQRSIYIARTMPRDSLTKTPLNRQTVPWDQSTCVSTPFTPRITAKPLSPPCLKRIDEIRRALAGDGAVHCAGSPRRPAPENEILPPKVLFRCFFVFHPQRELLLVSPQGHPPSQYPIPHSPTCCSRSPLWLLSVSPLAYMASQIGASEFQTFIASNCLG